MQNHNNTGRKLEELKTEHDRLKYESEQKSALIAFLSHDFKGAFSSFLWLIEAWEQKSISDTDFFNLLPEVRRDLRKNLNTISDIEEWMRIRADALDPDLSEFYIAELFVQLQLEFKIRLREKNIRLTFRGNETDKVFGDRQFIFFVLKKLVDNAVKYSPPGSEIYFEAVKEENGTTFRVRDLGVGMNEKQLESLFTVDAPVFRGTTGETGSGLSLKIIKNIVDLVGGTMNILTSENEGSTVSIFLKN